jgi:hypothetical protein
MAKLGGFVHVSISNRVGFRHPAPVGGPSTNRLLRGLLGGHGRRSHPSPSRSLVLTPSLM